MGNGGVEGRTDETSSKRVTETGDEYTKVCYTILIFMSDILVGAVMGCAKCKSFHNAVTV